MNKEIFEKFPRNRERKSPKKFPLNLHDSTIIKFLAPSFLGRLRYTLKLRGGFLCVEPAEGFAGLPLQEALEGKKE